MTLMEPIDPLPEPTRSQEEHEEDLKRIEALKSLIQPGVLAWLYEHFDLFGEKDEAFNSFEKGHLFGDFFKDIMQTLELDQELKTELYTCTSWAMSTALVEYWLNAQLTGDHNLENLNSVVLSYADSTENIENLLVPLRDTSLPLPYGIKESLNRDCAMGAMPVALPVDGEPLEVISKKDKK